MTTRTTLAALLVSTGIALGGCGVTYTSPSVGTAAGDVDVRVIGMTPQSVLIANRSAYTPLSLPGAFYATAGAGGGGIVGAGALPQPPAVPDVQPQVLELRAPPQADPGAYRIGVGDVVLLATRGQTSTVEQLSGLLAAQNQRQGYTVRDDGAIALPEIGTIMIAGMTVEEAENRIFEELVENQFDPAFSLEIAEFNSKRVSVGGAVQRASLVPITLNPLTLNEALTAAGGLTARDEQFASIRIYRDGTLYQIPVSDYFNRPGLQDLVLLDGDAVYVDLTYDLDLAQAYYEQQINQIGLRRTARAQALADLKTEIELRRAALGEQRSIFTARVDLDAEARDYVYLAGEVETQSRWALPYGRQASLADVIYDTGGFPTTTGDPSEIYVLRASSDPTEFGAVTAWHLDASNAANITLATRFEMRPDDIVFIEEQPITTWNRALQQIFPTLVNIGAASVSN